MTNQDWCGMLKLAETNPGMKDLLNQAEAYYKLINPAPLEYTANDILKELRARRVIR